MDNMNNKLQEGLFSLAPDCFDEIMARTPIRVESEEELLGRSQESYKRGKPSRRYIMSLVSAAAVLFLGIFSWNVYNQFHTVDQLYIDVNPSVCLSLNKAGKVTKKEGINPEGQVIISQAEEKIKDSSDPDAMFGVLLDELNSEGYFPNQEMEILLSYCYSSRTRTELLDDLSETAQKFGDEHGLKVILLVQSFSMDDPAVSEGLAKGISPGKCYLIDEMNRKYNVDLEDFELRSLEDLTEYAEENNLSISDLFPGSGLEDYASSDSSDQEGSENSTEENLAEADTKQAADTKNATADSNSDKPKSKATEDKKDSQTADKESKEESPKYSDTSEKKAETRKKTVSDSTKKKTEKKKKTVAKKKKKSNKKKNDSKKEETVVNPDKPVVPDKPDTPDTPDTPDIPTPAGPDEPDVPDQPDTPDTPDKPDTPDEPDKPDTPDEPDKPDTPDTPDEPDKPDTPDTPDNPDTPGQSQNPDWPNWPDWSNWPNWPNRNGKNGN